MKRPDRIQTCPLCKNDVPVFHKKSHIIPEWAYVDLYDEQHRVPEINLKSKTIKVNQKGTYSSYWCEKCEKESGPFDQYGSVVFAGHRPDSQEALSIKRLSHSGTIINQGNPITISYEHWQGLDRVRLHKFVVICCIRGELARRTQDSPELSDEQLEILIQQYQITSNKPLPLLVTKMLAENDFEKSIHHPFLNKIGTETFMEFHAYSYLFKLLLNPTEDETTKALGLTKEGSIFLPLIPYEEVGTINKAANDLREAIIKSMNKKAEH